MKSWKNIDKTGWGDGPWNDEPDKIQGIDEATGMDCLIVRGPMGALCGYVGVPPEHPWHGIPYSGREYDWENREADSLLPPATQVVPRDEAPDAHVEVHGGLTYSDSCDEEAPDGTGICHIPEPGRPENVWWFGFDCAHFRDLAPIMEKTRRERYEQASTEDEKRIWREPDICVYRSVDYVREQCAGLALQISRV